VARCGDGFVRAGVEQCDDGNSFSGDGCSATCQLEVPVCGNGVVEPGEECDDGNTASTDACTATCRMARCGDGFRWIGNEQCDDGNGTNTDACTNLCQTARCGDGFVQAGVEQCDDGNTTGNDGCSATCQVELPVCGNGVREVGEECDDGNLVSTDACTALCRNARCGDGFVRAGVEQCDDGNTTSNDGCSATCQVELPVCGNGVVQPGEECDDGNASNTDACLTTCRLARCGDGFVRLGVEQCDDGNTQSNDGCSAACQIEVAVCGNGIVQPGEECDDGNLSSNDACTAQCRNARCGDGFVRTGVEQCDDGNTQSNDGCSSTCQLELPVCGKGIEEPGEECDDGNASNTDACLTTCRNARCGDGFVRTGAEQCDDGNTQSNDGCSSTCQLELPVCGNGIVQPGEECDDGNTSNTDTCTGQCRVARCGDGFIWSGVEQCDDGNTVSGDGCSAACTLETAVCGNGIVQPGEECDDGNTSNTDACLSTCRSARCGDGFVRTGVEQCDDGNTVSGDGCSATCQLEAPVCGNGIVQTGEECDDGNTSNADACVTGCKSARCGDGYLRVGVEQCDDGNTTAGDGCSATCQIEAPVCGNGIVQAGEECDDGNTSNTDACTNLCRTARCGDGYIRTGVEQCDDGNTVNGDGCSATCQIEAPVCGNGIVQTGEECDDGNTSNTDACVSGCKNARCGDGYVRTGVEQCDDGNTVNGDGCSATCQTEPPVCGNGIVQAGEECDDGNTSNADACLNTCRNARCGDGYLRGGVEQCDDGNTVSGDGCSATCQIETPACGNGVVQPGEECDDGNTSNTDACTNLCKTARCGDGYTRAGVEECDDGNTSNTDACTSTCRNARCGDGFLRTGVEQCDDGNTVNGDGCSATCTLETATCGNGVKETGEQCDDGNASNTDACTNACRNAVCGDGYIRVWTEECDDGNTVSGDGCSATCQAEATSCVPDWAYLTCGGSDSWTTATGSGSTDAVNAYGCAGDTPYTGPEYTYTFQADQDGDVTVTLDTAPANLDVFVLGYGGGICDAANCVAWNGVSVTFTAQAGETYFILVDGRNGASGDFTVTMDCAGCGNGIPEAGEECDDGNTQSGDGCSATCTLEIAVCGNHLVETGEDCDDGNTQSGDGCSATCQWEQPVCEPAWELTCGGSDSWSTTATGATDQVDAYSCTAYSMTGPEYAYTFVPELSGTVRATLSGAPAALDLLLVDGSAAYCDPSSCLGWGNSTLTFQATAGHTYYLLVDGRSNVSGSFTVALDCAACGNGEIESDEECDEGPANETRYGLVAWQENGVSLAVEPVSRWNNASTFYGLTSASAHTGFEALGRSLAFLYQDRSTGILSLFFIHGIDKDTSGQTQPNSSVRFDVSGVPVGSTRALSDDVGEFTSTGATTYRGNWTFSQNTDGGIITSIDFPGAWTITVSPTWITGLTEWVWIDANSQPHALDMTKPLYITATELAVGCRADCTEPVCGDGILDPGELCDDGNLTPNDGCSSTCLSMP
jgi:cysteine-rich repeat protein